MLRKWGELKILHSRQMQLECIACSKPCALWYLVMRLTAKVAVAVWPPLAGVHRSTETAFMLYYVHAGCSRPACLCHMRKKDAAILTAMMDSHRDPSISLKKTVHMLAWFHLNLLAWQLTCSHFCCSNSWFMITIQVRRLRARADMLTCDT